MLLRRLAGARWVVVSPDGEVASEDLSEFGLIALGRDAAPELCDDMEVVSSTSCHTEASARASLATRVF